VTSLINAIQLMSTGLTIIIFLDIILGYFLDPFHPVRRSLDSFVEPMLAPIRRIMPPMGMIDLSPLVLLIVIQLIETVIIGILR
jgi:YggT family protein